MNFFLKISNPQILTQGYPPKNNKKGSTKHKKTVKTKK